MHLNPKFTFAGFVPSGPRAAAYRACRVFAESAHSRSRFIFLYGPPGVGKTHLLGAIGHGVLGRDRTVRMVAVTATELRDDIIRALREDSLPACRRKYSDAQLLIIDDLHGLAGHPATQVEAGLLVSACLGAGGTVACAATCRRAELDDFAMFRRSARGARLFEIRRPSPRHMARIIGHLARIGGVTVATRAADRIARHSRGDVRRAMGEVAGQKLQQALSVGR